MIEEIVYNTQRRFGERQTYVFVWSFSRAEGLWRPLAFTPATLAEAQALAAKHVEDCPPKPSRFVRVMFALFGP